MVLLWTITLELEGGFSFEMYISNRSIQHFILFTFDPLCGSPFIFRLRSCFGFGDTGFVDSGVSPFQLTFSRDSKVAAFSFRFLCFPRQHPLLLLCRYWCWCYEVQQQSRDFPSMQGVQQLPRLDFVYWCWNLARGSMPVILLQLQQNPCTLRICFASLQRLFSEGKNVVAGLKVRSRDSV